MASSIKDLSWIKDGIDGAESAVTQRLLYLAAISLPIASSVVSLGWVQDGVAYAEPETIDNLYTHRA